MVLKGAISFMFLMARSLLNNGRHAKSIKIWLKQCFNTVKKAPFVNLCFLSSRIYTYVKRKWCTKRRLARGVYAFCHQLALKPRMNVLIATTAQQRKRQSEGGNCNFGYSDNVIQNTALTWNYALGVCSHKTLAMYHMGWLPSTVPSWLVAITVLVKSFNRDFFSENESVALQESCKSFRGLKKAASRQAEARRRRRSRQLQQELPQQPMALTLGGPFWLWSLAAIVSLTTVRSIWTSSLEMC